MPLFFFNDTATTEIYTLSLHDALPISITDPFQPARSRSRREEFRPDARGQQAMEQPLQRRDVVDPRECRGRARSEEHTSELQSRQYLVCRLLLEKKKTHVINYALHAVV